MPRYRVSRIPVALLALATLLLMFATPALAVQCQSQPIDIWGTSGADDIPPPSTSGSDVIYADDGADHVYGNEMVDWICGNPGGDSLYGGPGGDFINAGDNPGGNSDTVHGNTGADEIHGGAGDDYLHADGGDYDYIYGATTATT
jgi:Ca2+-binding RTX toxin-like protein